MRLTSKFFATFVFTMMYVDFSGPLILKAQPPTPRVLEARQLELVGEILSLLGSGFVGLLTILWEILKFIAKIFLFSGRSHCHSRWHCSGTRSGGRGILVYVWDSVFKTRRSHDYHYRLNRVLTQGNNGQADPDEINPQFFQTIALEDEMEAAPWSKLSSEEFKAYLEKQDNESNTSVKSLNDDIAKYQKKIAEFQKTIADIDKKLPGLAKKPTEAAAATALKQTAQAEVASLTNMIEIKQKSIQDETDSHRRERIISIVTMAVRNFRQKIEDQFAFKNDAKAKAEYEKALKELESQDDAVSDAANNKIADLFEKLMDDSGEKFLKANARLLATELAYFKMKPEEAKDKLTTSVLKTFIMIVMKAQIMRINLKMKDFRAKKLADAGSTSSGENALAKEILEEYSAVKEVVSDVSTQNWEG